MVICSVGVNPNFQLYDNPDIPTIADEYRSSFARLRSLPADVPLGAHPAMYDMEAKYARLGGAPNPFIDPEGYLREIEINERAFLARYEEQRRAAEGR